MELMGWDQLPESKKVTMQLIGKDDSSFDDSEVLTGRWQAYIKSYTQVRDASLIVIDNPNLAYRPVRQPTYLKRRSGGRSCESEHKIHESFQMLIIY